MTIVNNTVNDVAATVLPDAPIDPATGLQVPTIAVATAGGVSVIKDDGTVVDLLTGLGSIGKISFTDEEGLVIAGGLGVAFRVWKFNEIPLTDSNSFDVVLHAGTSPSVGAPGNKIGLQSNLYFKNTWFIDQQVNKRGLLSIFEDRDDISKSLVAHLMPTYNTGWMPGDIKGAFLADTSPTALVGGTDNDRSVNSNPLNVVGTIQRTPVTTGAELVAYSGFSASNYLQGTDPIYVDTLYALGWVQIGGVWQFKHGLVSGAPIDGLTIVTNVLKIEGTLPKALIRLTATTPTAEQLAKIEADEKLLFQENAACTLYGTSDAVTALAHDPVTDLLHVGTSQGRSDFQGLRRVSNTTDPVTTAISASNGFIVEE